MLGKTFCELHFQQSVRKKRQPVPGHLKLERIQILSKLKLESCGGFSDSVSFLAIKFGATSNNNEPHLSVVVKETGVHDFEEDEIIFDPELEIIVFIPGKMSDFEKSQQFHIIREILLVINEMCYDGLEVQLAVYYDKKECRVRKACIPDLHKSFDFCSLIPCFARCDDIRDRHFHSKLQDLKMIVKSSKNKTWRFDLDVPLTSFNPFTLTKDLEESAKRTLSTKQEFKNNNLEHFLKHWGVGKLIIILAMIQTQPDLDWDFGFMLCEYLKISVEYQNNTKTGFCEIEFRRKQIYLGGIKHEYVRSESLKFKFRFSSDFLQDHFPDHYNAILQSLPIQEYMNPLMGFMNLGAYSPLQIKNPDLGSYVSLGYGGLDNPAHPDLLSNLCFHPYDENLPSIRENIKAVAKNINEKNIKKDKIVRKCHWCGLTSFCILIMCLTCRENFFCEDCIDNRYYCKRSVERKCPVCEGQCSCKASTCIRGKPKQVKTKKKVTLASIPEKMSDFEKSQHLHMIRDLLPVIAKLNQQKFIELDTEAKNKGTFHAKIEVQTLAYTDKKACR
ncbi:uncharacterized protein LOC143547553 [Bidens hawaiensis]|uniref:uncharacterized protein LOC143547553 n=1 Tax=Bidens hawaiensis TaxID=980011 RepID=UPI0040495EB1